MDLRFDNHWLLIQICWLDLLQWDSPMIASQTNHLPFHIYIYLYEFVHFFLFMLVNTTQIHFILYWRIEKLLIHIQYSFNLFYWVSGHGILLLIVFPFFLRVKLQMKLPTFSLYMAINVAMVARIFAWVHCSCHIFIVSPFLLLLLLLRSILLLLLLWSTWLCSL